MLKLKTGLLLVAVVAGLAACNGASEEVLSPTATVEEETSVSPTATIIPTEIPLPTATLRSDGPLSDEGPYLVYNDIEDGVNSVVLVNGDGSGRKIIPLPEDSTINNLRTSLSPDGQWLAFHVGTLSDTFEESADDSLTLNLMHLPGGEVTQVASLLSDDFMDKFRVMAEMLFARDDNPEYMTSSEAYLSSNWSTFRYGVDTLAWSPLGNYLAFTSQTEGISSDVYLYDMQTKTASRLSDEIGNIQYMNWSLDETSLLFGANYEWNVADTNAYYLADIEKETIGEIIVDFCGGSRYFAEWLSEYQVLTYCTVNVWGDGFLSMRDLVTDSFREIYSNYFIDYIFDTEQDYLLLSTFAIFTQDEMERYYYIPGIRFYYPATQSEVILREGTYYQLVQVSNEEFKYITSGFSPLSTQKNGEIIGITQEGEVVPIREYFGVLDISPDKHWIAADMQSGGLEIFSIQNESSYLLSDINIRQVFWHPDSQTVFFSTQNDELFYYDFMNDLLEPVDLIVDSVYPFAWIP